MNKVKHSSIDTTLDNVFLTAGEYDIVPQKEDEK